MFYGKAGEYRNEVASADPAVIGVADVRLINTERGRLTGGLRFDVGGSSFVNQAGAILRNGDPTVQNAPPALLGSAGADSIDNAGTIAGRVDLGDGADSFIGRAGSSLTAPSLPALSLGAGDDSARLEGVVVTIDGGSGNDTLTLAGAVANYALPSNVFTGFETLVLENGSALQGIAGLTRVEVRGAGTGYVPSASLHQADLSAAAISLVGGALTLVQSTALTVTGSDAAERLELLSGAVTGPIDLGGGDDVFWLEKSFANAAAPTPSFGVVAGGAGQDMIRIQTWEGQDVSYDFRRVTGFEALAIGYNVFRDDPTVRLAHLSGVATIDAVQGTRLVLTDSDLSATKFWGAFGGAVTLAGTTVLGSYAPYQPGADTRTDIQAGDDLLSVAFTNSGRVLGAIQFYTGDDVYDGRAGSVGGSVIGNAGNDTLLGGVGSEDFRGGYGADTLDGGAGDDRLDGGAGGDWIFGGDGNDVMIGGAGDDLLDGGAGYEMLSYAVLSRSAAVVRGAGTEVTIAAGGDVGTDTLRGIDDIVMKDGLLSFDENDDWAQVIRLYDTVLQRVPDAAGLDYHTARIASGQHTLFEVANDFLASPEFQQATGGLSNGDFVRYIYATALGREPDGDGLGYWTGQLDGGLSRATMLVNFSETAEHRAQTADAITAGYFTTDASYQDAALLYDTGLGRLPDVAGLLYWGEALKTGQQTPSTAAAGFATSGEFLGNTSGLTNAQLVDYMYQNTLDRAADANGRAYWLARLDAGLSKSELLLDFALSAEHRALLAPAIDHGIQVFG